MLVMILPWLILVFQYKSRDQPLSVSLVYKSSQLGLGLGIELVSLTAKFLTCSFKLSCDSYGWTLVVKLLNEH